MASLLAMALLLTMASLLAMASLPTMALLPTTTLLCLLECGHARAHQAVAVVVTHAPAADQTLLHQPAHRVGNLDEYKIVS